MCVNTMPRRKDISNDLGDNCCCPSIWEQLEGPFQTIWSPSIYSFLRQPSQLPFVFLSQTIFQICRRLEKNRQTRPFTRWRSGFRTRSDTRTHKHTAHSLQTRSGSHSWHTLPPDLRAHCYRSPLTAGMFASYILYELNSNIMHQRYGQTLLNHFETTV